VRHSPPGESVKVSVSEAPDQWRIEVSDRGPGIAPEFLPHLFERFYRADHGRSRDLGGTGLGLAIVKETAEAHGGRAEVESVPGEGATFRIVLHRGA
jgi:signal transduction histidine kinase